MPPSLKILKVIIKHYFDEVDGIIGVAICDREGFIIASEFKEGDEEEGDSIIGAISAILDSYIERIKTEFGTQGNFFNITQTGDKKFAFCSQGLNSILVTISNLTTSDTEIRVYSEHVASKIELVLEGNDDVTPQIPEIVKALAKTREGSLPKGGGEFSIKVILTGDYSVGKTSTILRYVKNKFGKSYIATLGVQISKKTVDLSDNTKMNFIIWDIAGQITQMATYRARFYNGANAAFIVIDRTREGNLASIDKWYADIKKSISKDITIVIVGNKSDLVDEIVITEEEIREVAQKYGFHYILTSAKTGENVNDAFLYIAYRVIENL